MYSVIPICNQYQCYSSYPNCEAQANKGIAPLADSLRSYASFAKALVRLDLHRLEPEM